MPRRRVWCETVPPEVLSAKATAALLARHRIDPIVAVWPGTEGAAREAAARFAGEGLRPALWPMLADADGRWIGAANAARFCAFAEELAASLAPAEIVLDLEPPIEAVRGTLASRGLHAHLLPISLDPAAFRAAREAIAGLSRRLREGGVAVSAAVAAPVLLDPPGRDGWQALLGTPVDGIAWDHVSPMLYTSIAEGWSRGLLRRADALALLGASALAAARRFGPAAGASLGAVGAGAFGDEPVYRGPDELAADVAVARAAGLDDLALFDLGGVLRRPPAEAWLDAFTATAPAPRLPDLGARARIFLGGARLAGEAAGLLGRLVETPVARVWGSPPSRPR
jgi:hypothetical protein